MGQRTCAVDGCGRDHFGRGYCQPHYRRWHRTGKPGGPVSSRRTPCRVEGCGSEASARGHCTSHYARLKRTGDAGEAFAWRRRDPLARDDIGRKQCRSCDGWFVTEAFPPSKRDSDGLLTTCSDCHHGQLIAKRYGVGADWYRTTLDSQGGTCAACGESPEQRRKMHVDHDHLHCPSGCAACVRGILCGRCNTGIGMFLDDPLRLRAAAHYLEKTRRDDSQV